MIRHAETAPRRRRAAPELPDDVVLSVRNVSKKFCRTLRRSMTYGVMDLALNMAGVRSKTDTLRKEEFWALQDVSFELRRGEALGLIGDNGAGKTTMLRLLTGIYPPDKGEMAIRGRIGALIALGAGFHGHMTGRENVYLNATILGMNRKEVNAKFDSIVDFAEIGEFLDAPVATYSSGMRVRLGFAIAIHTEPDLLLVDEVLAVGDFNFQEKCMRKMDEIRSSDRAVILVTHSLFRIESLCNRAIWMRHGGVVMAGEAVPVVGAYLDQQDERIMRETRTRISAEPAAGPTESPITVDSVELLDTHGRARDDFPFAAPLTVKISYTAHRRLDQPLFNLRFFCKGQSLLEASMLIDGHGPRWIEGRGVVECRFDGLPLTPKSYTIAIFVRTANGAADLCPMRNCAVFRVTDEGLNRIPMRGPFAYNHLRQGSPVYVPREWRFYKDGRLTDSIKSEYVR